MVSCDHVAKFPCWIFIDFVIFAFSSALSVLHFGSLTRIALRMFGNVRKIVFRWDKLSVTRLIRCVVFGCGFPRAIQWWVARG